LQSTDVVIVHAALLTIKKRLADMGVELYLYKGPETLHAKGAIIDDKISLIGSFNFDKKSAEINREIGIRVGANGAFTTEFTKEFSAFINTQVIGNSFLAAKDGVEFSLVEFDSNVSKTKKKTFNFSKKFVGLFRNII
jgi:phosphatidylserine/phosphatidylglycerophosphate/cardiolipin synthase-like enzyme